MGMVYKDISSQVPRTEQTGNESALLSDDIHAGDASQFLLKLQSSQHNLGLDTCGNIFPKYDLKGKFPCV